MSSLSSSPHFAPSLAFVSPPGAAGAVVAWQQAATQLLTRPTRLRTPIQSFADDNSNESEAKDSFETSDGELKKPPTTTKKTTPNMGASIGAQNVGEMLFNEQLLKSGRGDVRVGPMRRWKDFRGNEIVPDDNNTDGPN
jgi:hypothetical protein